MAIAVILVVFMVFIIQKLSAAGYQLLAAWQLAIGDGFTADGLGSSDPFMPAGISWTPLASTHGHDALNRKRLRIARMVKTMLHYRFPWSLTLRPVYGSFARPKAGIDRWFTAGQIFNQNLGYSVA